MNENFSDLTATPVDTVPLNPSISPPSSQSQSTSEDDSLHLQRGYAIAGLLGERRGSNNSTASEEGNRGALTRSR